MNIEAVIFDLDGVLLNSDAAWQEAISKTVEEFAGSWTKEDRQVMGRHMTPKGWSTWIKKRAELDARPEEIHASVIQNLISSFKEDLPLAPGARETVHALAGKYPLALATGSDREVVEAFLAISNMGDYFSVSLAAEDIQNPKPDPEIYQKALNLLGTRAECTLAVEDSDAGIQSALGAGLTTICYLDEERPAKNLDRVRLVLRQLNALPELLLWPRSSRRFIQTTHGEGEVF